MAGDTQKIIFLNWIVSRSRTRKRSATPPTIALSTLLDILKARMDKKIAIEFPKMPSVKITDDQDEVARIRDGAGETFIRLSDISITETDEFKYASLLLKYIDADTRGFSVEDMLNFTGREIAGSTNERAVTAAHISVRIPKHESQFDDGKYRCTIDAVSPLSRSAIERFLCRQIARQTRAEKWTFSVREQKKRSKKATMVVTECEYTPYVELLADVGRSLSLEAGSQSDLSSMVFTKRAERQSVHDATEVKHTDFIANVEIKISGNQGPTDPTEKATWVKSILDHFSGIGFDSKIYYKHQNGAVVGGGIHHALESAADILMCPKEMMTIDEQIQSWEPKVNPKIEAAMKELLDRDELWEQKK